MLVVIGIVTAAASAESDETKIEKHCFVELAIAKRVDERIDDRIAAGNKHEYVDGEIVVFFAGEREKVGYERHPA